MKQNTLVINRDGTYFVKSKYTEGYDLVLVIGPGGGNGLPDIRRVYLVENDGPLNENLECSRIVLEHCTDLIGPQITKAVENGDGDHPELLYFTGGNHQDNNKGENGNSTARCLEFTCKCNGIPVNDCCYCDEVVFQWTNFLQGYNTTHTKGAGREIIREDVKLTVSEGKANVEVCHTALEDVIRQTYYGLQMVTTCASGVMYPGEEPACYHPIREYTYYTNPACRDIWIDNDHHDRIAMHVDSSGLGDFANNHTDHNVFTRHYGKSYFNLIQNTDYLQRAGETTCFSGYFHFYKAD